MKMKTAAALVLLALTLWMAIPALGEAAKLPIDLSGEMPKIILPFDQGFDDIYIITMDVDLSALHLQESEVQAVRWAGMEDIFALMKAGQFLPYHRSLIELLFAMKDSRGAHVSRLG